MSWSLVKLVFERYPADRRATKNVLMAMADQARGLDGSSCYPSQEPQKSP